MGFFGKKAAAPVVGVDPALDGPPPRPDAKKPEPASPKRKLWAALLVLDVVFIFIFGGAVAALMYMRSGTPSLAQAPTRPPKAKRGAPAEPPKEPPKEEPTKPAEPRVGAAEPRVGAAEPRVGAAEPKTEAKAEPAAKPPEPKAAQAKPADRPTGSPAIHAAALPKHSAEPITATAKTEKTSSPPAKAEAKPAGKVRAIPVEFTHHAPSAKEVLLRAPFLVRTGGRQLMVKDSGGIWHLSLSLWPGTYRYSFMVDGKRTASETRLVE